MLTILEIIKKTTDFFAAKGVESPRLNAELLIGHALGLKRMALYLQFERPLAETELEKIRPLVRRRAQREPLQYVLGETDFRGLRIKVDRRALIPRPETELLVEHAITEVQTPTRILDLGTGTGAIALSLAQAYPAASVVAVDSNQDALVLARENAAAVGLTERVCFLASNWYSALQVEARFDLIVSNPPYLSAAETAETAAEVRGFEPWSALTAADEGLADLRAIIVGAPVFLATGGVLMLETGITQHAQLKQSAYDVGFKRVEGRQDLTGRDRYLLLWR